MVIRYGRGFIVKPKSVLRSSSCSGTFLIHRPWSSVVRKINISKRASLSPRQRLFPIPKMRTFSVSSLFNSPDGSKKRSGRKAPGSPQMSLGKMTSRINTSKKVRCQKNWWSDNCARRLTCHGWLDTGWWRHKCLWVWSIHSGWCSLWYLRT